MTAAAHAEFVNMFLGGDLFSRLLAGDPIATLLTGIAL